MAKLIGILGACALVFAIIDLIHGPHNGDAHRLVIHIAEFISFSGFLCLLEVWAFKAISRKFELNHWLVSTFLSLSSWVLGFIFFGVSGGSFLGGDGGPIAFSFFFIATIGVVVPPVSFIGFVIVAISRKRNGVPILYR